MKQPSQQIPSQKISFNSIKRLIEEANKLRDENKFQDAKFVFDKYFQSMDEYYRLHFSQSCFEILGKKGEFDKNKFKSIDQLKLQELVKFKSQFKHLDQYQFIKTLQTVNLTQENAIKLAVPSVIHTQIDLINLKVSFYKSIGLQKEVSKLGEILKFSTKSTLFPIPPDHYSLFLKKTAELKKQGHYQKAVKILKQALDASQNKQDRELYYKKLAEFLKQIDKDGNEVMTCFDKAIELSDFNKVELSRQRRVTLQQLSNFGTIDTHKGLLKYFDQIAKNSKQNKLPFVLIEKAIVLKGLKDFKQAYTTFTLAVHKVPKIQLGVKYQLLVQQAYFCKDIKKYQQAITCITKANQMNPGNQKAKFLQKMLQITGLDQATLDLLKIQIKNTLPRYPFGSDTKRYKDQAIKMKKSGKILEPIQLLKKGIKVSTNENQQTSIFYRALAQYLIGVDKDGHQIMNCYEKALECSSFDRVEIQRQRKDAINIISSSGSVETHKGFLKYFDDSLKQKSKGKSSDILIEKAIVLKNIGDFNQAYTAFSKAIQSVSEINRAEKYRLLLEKAYFCQEIKKYKQALVCIKEADQLNPSINKSRFLQSLLKIPNLDEQILDLVNTEISNTSLDYPFGCDRKQYVQRSSKLKKVGNINQAIELLKSGIKKTTDDYLKSKIYRRLAHYLKEKDKDGHQIMTCFDQAILLSENQKTKIIDERRLAFFQLCSIGTINEHQGLAKYFEQRSKTTRPNKLTESLLQKADFYKRLKDINGAINSYNQAVKSLKKDHILWKAQILRQLAFYLCDNEKIQEGLLTFQKAQKLSKVKNFDRIRILWLAGKSEQIEQIIQKSNDPYELKVLATLFRSKGDKQMKIGIDPRQNYEKSISIFTKAINLLDDLKSIQSFLKYQANVIMKVHELKDIDDKVIKDFQKKLLVQKGIFFELQQVRESEIKFQKQLLYPVNYQQIRRRGYWFISKKTLNYLEKYRKIDEIVAEICSQSYLDSKFIIEILNKMQIFYVFAIRTFLHKLFQKLWESKRYEEAVKIYQKICFFKPQLSFINENQVFYVAQKVSEVKKQYKLQNYENCLNLLKVINSSLSIQQSVKVSICKNRSLDLILQKIQAISLWNIGRYESAAKVFSDMAFYSKKDISQFLNQKPNSQQDIDCKNIVKYSAIVHNMKQNNYEKALIKMKKFQQNMNEGKLIKDSQFYFMYIEASFAEGKKLKYLGNDKYLDRYCDLIQKFKSAQKLIQMPQGHQVRVKKAKIVNELRQSFFENVNKIQQKIIIFRDLHISNKQKCSTFDEIRDELYNINRHLKISLKIVSFNIIHQSQKIVNLKNLKQCWQSTCYVIYKQVVNKGVTENITYVNNLINELRNQVIQIKNEHGKLIDKDTLQKLPDILKEIKQNYVDQFQSVLGSKTNDSLRKISEAYQKIKDSLRVNQTNHDPQKIIEQIVKKCSDIETNNNFFNDMIADLQDRISKLSQSEGRQKVNKQDLQKIFDDVRKKLVDDIEKRMQKTRNQIDQAHQVMNKNLQKMLSNNPKQMQHSQVIKQLVAGHLNMKDENKFFQDMMDQALNLTDNLNEKVDQLQKVISGLQQTTQNKIGIQQIQSMLKNLTSKHLFKEITEESQAIVKKLLKDIEQNQFKLVQLQKRIYDYVQKNISKLLDNISTILEPINDGNMEKFFKRFKDDLYLRDIKIKDLEGKLTKFVESDQHNLINQRVQNQLVKLNQQNKVSKNNIQKLNQELKLAEQKFINMANNRDLKQIKKQLKINQQKSQDLKNKLDLLQFDTFINNYNQLIDSFQQLKSYIRVNDKKIGILSQKLGTKIVTSFNNILRNDDVTMKGGKLKFKPQKEEILLNINDNNPETVEVHKSIDKMELTMPKIQKNVPSFYTSRSVRNKKVQSSLKAIDLPQFIDKGRRHVDIEGQVDRKVNVVIMKDNFINQEEKNSGRRKIKSRKL